MSNREDLIFLDNARVASIVLEADEESPWHYHSELVEYVICLNGTIDLQTNEPKRSIKLQPAKHYKINPMQVHRLVNTGQNIATYLLVQNGNYDFISSNS